MKARIGVCIFIGFIYLAFLWHFINNMLVLLTLPDDIMNVMGFMAIAVVLLSGYLVYRLIKTILK